MAFEIAKAGWLHRQSSVLKRWKKNWFVLYVDGHLKYFENPNKSVAEDAANMKTECFKITCGLDLIDVNPPDNMTRNCLFQLKFRDKEWNCCAESMDDMRAWQVALEQARVVSGLPATGPLPGEAPPPYAPHAAPAPHHQQTTTVHYPQNGTTTTVIHQGQSPYPIQGAAMAYPGQIYYGSHPPPVVMQNPQQQGTQVIYVNGEPRYRRADGTDIMMGVVAGAAIGSMMWGPMWW